MKTSAKSKQRYCAKCGASIVHRRLHAIYCKKCVRENGAKSNKEYHKKWYQRKRLERECERV